MLTMTTTIARTSETVVMVIDKGCSVVMLVVTVEDHVLDKSKGVSTSDEFTS